MYAHGQRYVFQYIHTHTQTYPEVDSAGRKTEGPIGAELTRELLARKDTHESAVGSLPLDVKWRGRVLYKFNKIYVFLTQHSRTHGHGHAYALDTSAPMYERDAYGRIYLTSHVSSTAEKERVG